MITQLAALDHELFFFINRSLDNVLFNWLMPWMREPKLWIPLYVFFLYLLIKKKKKKSWLWIIGLALTIGTSDYLASGIFKPNFERPRPCWHTNLNQEVIIRKHDGSCGGKYGFASSHASNHFALALFLSLALMWTNKSLWRWLLFLWAGIIAFAQVYVGVHFPGDVLVGAILGIIAAQVFYRITFFVEQKIYP